MPLRPEVTDQAQEIQETGARNLVVLKRVSARRYWEAPWVV